MKFVVDANVCVGWFLPVPSHERDKAVLLSGVRLIAPDLLIPEATSAAWKMFKVGMISDSDVALLLQELPLNCSLHPSRELSQSAYHLARVLNHSPYDCFYLALAERENTRLISADQKLINKLADTPYNSLALSPEQFARQFSSREPS